jgi:hypothetical protein
MGKAIKEVFEYIDSFLRGEIEPMEFSWDLQFLIAEKYREIKKENSEVADLLNDEFPDVCDIYEEGDPLEPFQAKIRETYEHVKAMI